MESEVCESAVSGAEATVSIDVEVDAKDDVLLEQDLERLGPEALYQQLIREGTQIQVRAESLERDVVNLARNTLEDAYEADEALAELEARAQCLLELRCRMKDIEEQVVQILRECPCMAAYDMDRSKVSFAEDRVLVQRYLEDPLRAVQSPRHGHWLPGDVLDVHADFNHNAAKQLGGRLVKLETGPRHLGTVECVLVEPMAKYVNPSAFICTGLAICIHGLPATEEVLEEWGHILKSTKLLDAGLSFALPDIAASAATQEGDLEAVVLAVLTASGASHCVLIGKAWGGQQAARLAAMEDGPLSGRVSGLLLLAPNSPAPEEACRALGVPVFMLWAKDDEVSPWEGSEDWQNLLGLMRAPVAWAIAEVGDDDDVPIGHNHALMLEEYPDVGEMVLHFAAAVQIMAILADFIGPKTDAPGAPQDAELAEAVGQPRRCSVARARLNILHKSRTLDELVSRIPNDADSRDDDSALPAVVHRLCEELPPFLATQLEEEPDLGFAAAAESACRKLGGKRGACSLTVVLRGWLRSNMQQMGAAKE